MKMKFKTEHKLLITNLPVNFRVELRQSKLNFKFLPSSNLKLKVNYEHTMIGNKTINQKEMKSIFLLHMLAVNCNMMIAFFHSKTTNIQLFPQDYRNLSTWKLPNKVLFFIFFIFAKNEREPTLPSVYLIFSQKY